VEKMKKVIPEDRTKIFELVKTLEGIDNRKKKGLNPQVQLSYFGTNGYSFSSWFSVTKSDCGKQTFYDEMESKVLLLNLVMPLSEARKMPGFDESLSVSNRRISDILADYDPQNYERIFKGTLERDAFDNVKGYTDIKNEERIYALKCSGDVFRKMLENISSNYKGLSRFCVQKDRYVNWRTIATLKVDSADFLLKGLNPVTREVPER